jgi:hypothetical protein
MVRGDCHGSRPLKKGLLMKYNCIITVLILLMVIPVATLAADLDGYSFKKFSAEDQKAVVKTPQGELALVGVGDRVGSSATITQIFADYVELKQVTPQGPETLMVYVVDGKQKITVRS